ncbi:Caspase domain-containing protein [Lentzea fradiae]|uniref:Caspase domain-containing protein n=1 Tax=Lentzea fradiae TaxID=200378 RepID=A0A1G7RAQ0_9PSEU|nr:caspase family protein [Lentzea fradiae]SDG07848.1 Caspase domain-containing protein [Lentzea fradiae]
MTDVTLRVHEDGADGERIEQLTAFLRTELRELVAVSEAPGERVGGAKALDPAEIGTVLTTISQSAVLAALINAVSAWLGRRRDRSVTVEADGDPLELTGAPTEEELAARRAWLGRHLRRHALIIASYEFADPGLSALRAPAHDAARLAEVLGDPRIGGFDVRTLVNAPAAEINEAVEDFFADRAPDDLLVLHFSGHGVKDEAGELHFATTGTKLSRLAGTAVSADFVARRMNRSRSRRVVLLLDCCYSGAFGRGMVARAGGPVGLQEQFGGSGRAVITASSAVEYAFEGSSITDASAGEPSVFTAALVEGLATGEADRDQDGHVGLDELYEYVYDRVRRVTPHQTPGKWMLDVRGDLRIARRALPVTVPVPLPSELQEAVDHSLPGVRAGAVPELRRLLTVAHEGRALAARLALRRLVDDDSRMVAAAAREALEEGPPVPREALRESAAKETKPRAAVEAKPSAARKALGEKVPAASSTPTTPPVPRRPVESRKLSVPPETMGVGAPASPEGDQAESIPHGEGRAAFLASEPDTGQPSHATGRPQHATGLPPHVTGLPSHATGQPPHTTALPASLMTALPRLAAGLALTLLVLGYMTRPSEGFIPYAAPVSDLVPWALAAAVFALTCRDHPWVPGAALGLLAATTGLLSGGDTTSWTPLGLAAVALAVAVAGTKQRLAMAAGLLGAVGVYVVAASAHDLTPIGDDGEDITLIVVVAALVCLAAYRQWLDKTWASAIAPVLLLLDAVMTVSAEAPAYVHHASLAGLVVVPLIAAATTGPARFAGVVTVAGVILVQANAYVSANEPSFTTVAHVVLPLAAALVAYFSRSR